MPRAAAVALLFAAGCQHTGSANTFAGAASMTALAIGASAVERASGGCIAVCTNGTACNPRTGLCEVLPCRGRCGADEHCEVTYASSRCAPGVTGVTGQSSGSATKIPVLPPPPASSGGPPQIVPKAEEPR